MPKKRIEKCTFEPCLRYCIIGTEKNNCFVYLNLGGCKTFKYIKALKRAMNANPIAKKVFAEFNKKFKERKK